MKTKLKILLGTPVYEGKEYCLHYWVKLVKEIRRISKCDILLIDNSKSNYYNKLIKSYNINVIKSKHYNHQPLKTLAVSRKLLYEYAIKNNYDFLFSLEQDVFPPRNILKHLMAIRKKLKEKNAVIGVPYAITRITKEKRPYVQFDYLTNVALNRIYYKPLRRKIQNNLTRLEMLRRKKIFKAYACGLGCTLIDVPLLKKIKIKFTEKAWRPDDAFFFLDLSHMHIPVYVDPKLMDKVIHIEGSSKSIASWGKERKDK